jgi:methylthioribose-1-phosphate isomerase
LLATPEHQRKDKAWDLAQSMADEDVSINRRIGLAGLTLLEPIDKPIINVLTHCNAGWLATIDFGTALSPIYEAKAKGLAVHVWVDETRPRNQGMSLTAWELEKAGIPHTVISDNAGGLLMQQGKVDCVLVGADRVGIDGSVCNKIGTYLKALPAKVHKVPFYVAAPKSTLDKDFTFANQTFEIENRDERELFRISGINKEGHLTEVRIGEAKGYNPAFDITPPEYISKLICEDGVFDPSQLRGLLL